MAHVSSELTFSSLEHLVGGTILAQTADEPIEHLLVDSRKAGPSRGTLFFAMKGERHDGHQHLTEVHRKGVRNFVVENPDAGLPQDANVILVRSSVAALQAVARSRRERFPIPVVGITGSNGKTILKEWLYQLLSPFEVIAKNPGSYNSQIGVPLSVWQLAPHHSMGIFEAGISRPGEMEHLREVIRPSIGIFTNIGTAHDEGFASRQEKIREKLKLFTGSQVVIYCRDHEEIHREVTRLGLQAFTWGSSGRADIRVTSQGTGRFRVGVTDREYELAFPFSDPASVENCFHAVALMIHLGHRMDDIQNGIDNLHTVPMRLELKEGTNQCYLIDDTYNNDLAGLEISLQFLAHQQQKKKKTVILSDILESGLTGGELAERISQLITHDTIHRFIGIGPVLSAHAARFPSNARFFSSTREFLDASVGFHDEIILVKGARSFHFEEIVKRLQRKIHGTVMEIDLGALVHNLNTVRSFLDRRTRIMVMVKAFAYGSGSNEIASLLQYHRVDYLGVAYADEGIELRKNNIALPVMVMNPSADAFEQLLDHDLEPELYTSALLESFIRFAGTRRARVHIKIDTGMHRLGFEEHQIDAVARTLRQHPNITVASVFSHLAGADESRHDAFSARQAEAFLRSAGRLSDLLGYKPLYHILNSPGILRLPQYQFDMVRLGIGLYGVDPTGKGGAPFRPVATLKTVISQIKTVPAGDTVGYGRWGVASSERQIATIAIGYADGFSRAFSRGVGHVLVNGKRAPVMGNVCMDMTMVDVTGLDAREGDEVVIFGKDLPISEVAALIHTIPYEILTNTSERVKRVFVAESI